MNVIYHYTSQEKWKAIQDSGVLIPKSYPAARGEMYKKYINDLRSTAYTVGLSEPIPSGWMKYELMSWLMVWTKGEVLLEVPITDKDNTFIREHAEFSPRTFKQRFGTNLWEEIRRNPALFTHPRNQALFISYLKTSTPLNDYAGNFKAPEIWTPQETPVEIIKVIDMTHTIDSLANLS